MLLTSSFATYNIISTITHEKRHDIAIMKSLGMREYSVRRIFIIESAIMGSVGILFGWLLGYLLCYAWSQINVYNSADGRGRTASDLLVSDALCRLRRHLYSVLRRRGLLSGTQGDAGASGRDYPGRVLTEIALQTVNLGPPRSGRDLAHAGQWHRPGGGEGRVSCDHRSFRIGEIIAALSARPARCAHRRRGHHLRPGDLQIIRNGARRRPADQVRLRVSVPLPAFPNSPRWKTCCCQCAPGGDVGEGDEREGDDAF